MKTQKTRDVRLFKFIKEETANEFAVRVSELGLVPRITTDARLVLVEGSISDLPKAHELFDELVRRGVQARLEGKLWKGKKSKTN